MEKFGSKKDLLEFEFIGEVGSGLGPTLEFYDLVCQEIKSLDIWQKTDDLSLFPSCINSSVLDLIQKSSEELKSQFRMIGNIVGRAIYDLRTIDLPINKVFWKLVTNEYCSVDDLKFIDVALFTQISKLKSIQQKSQSQFKKEEDLFYDGVEIEELCIPFVIPGTNIELIPRGNNTFLSLSNLGEYLESFEKCFFIESLKIQIKSFRQGLCKVISEKSLRVFFASEIETLYYGESKSIEWDEKELYDSIIPAYGFTKDSPTFLNFLRFLNNLELFERKEFLKFITGAPRLPLGGLSALSPKITVVKKLPTGREKVNEMLPSVMTCQNYVKLPDYSNYEILASKLKYAIKEGQNSFSLS